MTLFFALRNGHAIYQQLLDHSPLGPPRTSRMAEAARAMLVASFYGVVSVAAAQGILCGLGAWIAGLPSPALWGLATSATSVIPVFGSALVWVPASITLLTQGSVGYGIFMLIWGALLISQVDSLVRPWVLIAQVPMNGLVIFITLLGGVHAFGLIGIFMGPVILAATLELLGILREEIGHADGTA
jgi:predicted PurR-regulated permease PerM